MRNFINYKILTLLILILISGCGEPEFTIQTKIFSDGSCERTLIINNIDSPEIISSNLPISIDSTWQMIFQVDTSGDEPDTTYFLSKYFSSVEDLNREYSDTGNKYSLVDRSIKLTKKFRWFNTFYEFSETYRGLFQGKPMTNFISNEEYKAFIDEKNDSLPIFQGLDTTAIEKKRDSIETKYLKWIMINVFDAYFNALLNNIEDTEKLTKYKNELINKKDTIFKKYTIFEEGFDTLFYYMDSLLEADGEILYLKTHQDSSFILVNKKLKFWEDIFLGDKLKNEVIMPGLLLSTNADSINNDTLLYNVTWEKFFSEDYVMEAETKTLNKWAYYVTGAIVIIILLFLYGIKNNFLRKSAY